MSWFQESLLKDKVVPFAQSVINCDSKSEKDNDHFGGLIYNEQLAWIAKGSLLEVFSVSTGFKVSSYRFDNIGYDCNFITCLTELKLPITSRCIIAIGLQYTKAIGGLIAIYSVHNSKLLRCIEVKEKITSCYALHENCSRCTVIKNFDGCLVIGTDTANIILLDIDYKICTKALKSSNYDDSNELITCYVAEHCNNTKVNVNKFINARNSGLAFGVQLPTLYNAGLVLSMLQLPNTDILVVGFENGNMVLYDLISHQLLHVANSPLIRSPLVKLTSIEQTDANNKCVYIWAFHENAKTGIAVMHAVSYISKKFSKNDTIAYKKFKSCEVQLVLPLLQPGSIPITCKSVIKPPLNENDVEIILTFLIWKVDELGFMIIFDLNQWKKENRPSKIDWETNQSFLASFCFQGIIPLDIHLNYDSITSFESFHEREEYLYPESLSFDCCFMDRKNCTSYKYYGIQVTKLNMLKKAGVIALFEPEFYFSEIKRASLVPECIEKEGILNYCSRMQRYVILSVALEHHLFSFLNECAFAWANKSFLNETSAEQIFLSVFPEWILEISKKMNESCNRLYIPLFNFSEDNIKDQVRSELRHFGRKFKCLSQLLQLIITKLGSFIPIRVFEDIKSQNDEIKLKIEYQEVIDWLLSIGLLPEGNERSENNSRQNQNNNFQYPYEALKKYYREERVKYKNINPLFLNTATNSCNLIYIDAFLDNDISSSELTATWVKCGGSLLYPPPSLQAMLRIFLISDIPTDKKFAVFLYLLFDIKMMNDDRRFVDALQEALNLPLAFNVSRCLMKTIRAFWNLDHKEYEIAVAEIMSPSRERLLKWQKELLIEVLLIQDYPQLALRALDCPGSSVSSLIEMKTLLTNELISKAYHFQRIKNDKSLLYIFFTGCFHLGKSMELIYLTYTPEEEKFFEEFLLNSNFSEAENILFLYLIQRSRYAKAVILATDTSHFRKDIIQPNYDLPRLLLTSVTNTMTPINKKLCEIYNDVKRRFLTKDYIPKEPQTFSAEILQGDYENIDDKIYHGAIISTDQINCALDSKMANDSERLCQLNHVPFIRNLFKDTRDFHNKQIPLRNDWKKTGKRVCTDDNLFSNITDLNNLPKRRRVQYAEDNMNGNLKGYISPIPQDIHNQINDEPEDHINKLKFLKTPIVENHLTRTKLLSNSTVANCQRSSKTEFSPSTVIEKKPTPDSFETSQYEKHATGFSYSINSGIDTEINDETLPFNEPSTVIENSSNSHVDDCLLVEDSNQVILDSQKYNENNPIDNYNVSNRCRSFSLSDLNSKKTSDDNTSSKKLCSVKLSTLSLDDSGKSIEDKHAIQSKIDNMNSVEEATNYISEIADIFPKLSQISSTIEPDPLTPISLSGSNYCNYEVTSHSSISNVETAIKYTSPEDNFITTDSTKEINSSDIYGDLDNHSDCSVVLNSSSNDDSEIKKYNCVDSTDNESISYQEYFKESSITISEEDEFTEYNGNSNTPIEISDSDESQSDSKESTIQEERSISVSQSESLTIQEERSISVSQSESLYDVIEESNASCSSAFENELASSNENLTTESDHSVRILRSKRRNSTASENIKFSAKNISSPQKRCVSVPPEYKTYSQSEETIDDLPQSKIFDKNLTPRRMMTRSQSSLLINKIENKILGTSSSTSSLEIFSPKTVKKNILTKDEEQITPRRNPRRLSTSRDTLTPDMKNEQEINIKKIRTPKSTNDIEISGTTSSNSDIKQKKKETIKKKVSRKIDLSDGEKTDESIESKRSNRSVKIITPHKRKLSESKSDQEDSRKDKYPGKLRERKRSNSTKSAESTDDEEISTTTFRSRKGSRSSNRSLKSATLKPILENTETEKTD